MSIAKHADKGASVQVTGYAGDILVKSSVEDTRYLVFIDGQLMNAGLGLGDYEIRETTEQFVVEFHKDRFTIPSVGNPYVISVVDLEARRTSTLGLAFTVASIAGQVSVTFERTGFYG